MLERLRRAPAYWLATIGTGGRPHIVPVWGVFVDDDVYLEVGAPSTAKVRHLRRDPRVAVHLDDSADVVIVEGRALSVIPEGALADALVEAFGSKYAGYGPGPDAWDDGSLGRLEPRTVLAWHDMPSATRWRIAPS
jgi:nitroimidazol reductase NimA-like FMN-containing flavoprotein (pyridoxamine 5'-phosphate oxidase superfamily)